MEYLKGVSLREVNLTQRGPLPWAGAAFIAAEVARGLAAAHALRGPDAPAGLLHGDLSPSNVMICDDGAVKLLDFGLARPSGREPSVSGVQGKLAYLPPEAVSGIALDHRTDLYSLGVTLYEMLAGVRPFQAQNDLELIERIRSGEVRPPSAHVSSVPRELEELVCLPCRESWTSWSFGPCGVTAARGRNRPPTSRTRSSTSSRAGSGRATSRPWPAPPARGSRRRRTRS
jgi:serine/threonine protein kinase